MKRVILNILFFACIASLYAQTERYKGCIVDSVEYYSVPRVKEQTMRSLEILPAAYSLKKYCPSVRDQGETSTCTAWACAYAARTIAEAVRNDWTDKKQITEEAFAPGFIYHLIKPKYSNDCDAGTHISTALAVMSRSGTPKYKHMRLSCYSNIHPRLYTEAEKYKLHHYARLFDPQHVCTMDQKVKSVKKAISEEHPVIIGMWTPESFDNNKASSWVSRPSDSRPNDNGSKWHAMCVVAYDDSRFNKKGGFQIMNSWGEDWGGGGFTWISYQDFFTFVRHAYEIYMDPLPTPPEPDPIVAPQPTINPVQLSPQPKPIIQPEIKKNSFSGSIELQYYSGEIMTTDLIKDNDMMAYEVTSSNLSGTRFRIYLSNNAPAYVYVISSDIQNNAETIFPPDKMTSAALMYKTNNIAIPDEKHCIEIRGTSETNYLCAIYSVAELDIDKIIKQVKQANGDFYQKIQSVFGKQLVKNTDIKRENKKIEFSSSSIGKVLPIIVEMPTKL